MSFANPVYLSWSAYDLERACRERGLPSIAPPDVLAARLTLADSRQHEARLDDAERRLDIARRALEDAIQRAAARGDRDEVEALRRDRRLLGGG